jgi:hypothetical protein
MDAPTELFSVLGGTPAPGGAWSGPGYLNEGVFDPYISTPGTYTYTVIGTPPCPNVTAQVTAIVNTAPNPGTSSIVTVCQNSEEIDLLAALGGTIIMERVK